MVYNDENYRGEVVYRLKDIDTILKNYLGESSNEDSGGFGDSSENGGAVSRFSKVGGKIAGIFTNIHRSINLTKSELRSMYGDLNHIIEPWAKADKAASKFSKTIGMTEQGMKNLRKNAIDSVINGKIGINYNISTDELITAQQNYLQSVGRNLKIDSTQQETFAAMTAVMEGRSTELAAAFENFGVNLNSVGDHAFKMFKEASKSGLSFEKYSDNVVKNIKIAQNYTFKNGLKGLENMAKKATALKLDMGQVASFADKVSTIEGSIDVASKLQVLGGPFAAMSDPMAMLSEGLMDMEGLTDRIIKMVGGLGNFNRKTGEVEVSAFNKQRIKAAAEAMGMDYSQLMESVHASGRRSAIDREIASSVKARGLDEDMKELLRNTATFNKEGKAGISVNGEFKSIEDLKNEDYKTLVAETQGQAADIKDIARTLRSWGDIDEGIKKQYEANKASIIENSGVGEGVKSIGSYFGEANGLLKIIAGASIANSLGNVVSSFIDIGRGIMKLKGGNSLRRATSTSLGISTPNKIENFENAITKSKKGYNKLGGIGKRLGKSKQAIRLIKGGKGLKVASVGIKSVGKKVPIVGGLVGGAFEAYENKDKFKDRATRGSAIGKTAGSAIGAGIGTILGGALVPVLGPLGPILGGIVFEKIGKWAGGAIGKIQDKRITKNRVIVDKQLEEFGIKRKGDYKVKHLKQIDKALRTGEMSDSLRRKLLEQGDSELVNKIDSIKNESKNKIKERNGGLIEKGDFSVKNAYFNGIPFGVDNIGPRKVDIKHPIDKSHENIGVIKCIPEKGKGITPYQTEQLERQRINQGKGSYDINISGTITLASSNGNEVDITDKLLNNDVFIRQLTDNIIKETGQNNYGVQRADVNSMGRM